MVCVTGYLFLESGKGLTFTAITLECILKGYI